MDNRGIRNTTLLHSILFFLSVFLPAMIVVVLVSVGNYRREIRAETALIEKNEELLVGFERTLIGNQLNGVLEDVKFLAEQVNLVGLLSSGFDPSLAEPLLADYESFLQRKQVYSELRILDIRGMEKIRVEFYDGDSSIVPEADRRSRDDRYYFLRATELPPQTIYVSNIDLREESTKGDPGAPVIRFAAPLNDKNGNRTAILVLTYNADNILRPVEDASTISFGHGMLLDPNGFWLHSYRQEDEWGFIYPERSHRTFAADHPDIWESMSKMDGGISRNDDSIVVFATVYPLLDPQLDAPRSMWQVVHDYPGEEGYYWYLVSYIPRSLLIERTADFRRRITVSGSTIIFGLFLFSLMFLFMRRKRILAESRIAEEASIFAHNPAPVLRASADGRLVKANPAAHRVFPRETITNQTISVFSSLDSDALSSLEFDDSCQFEQRLGDSTYFFTVKRNPADRSLLFYGSDITTRKEIQEEITRLSAAVEQSATAILITDCQGTISFANSACAKGSGYTIEELVGNHTRLFKSGEQGFEVYRELWSTIGAGGVWTGEIRNRKKSGELYWEEMSITPIRDESGSVSGYLAVKDDITRRKETEEQLTKAKEEAESASRLKSEFLANMSHEIRTPMNAILGFTDFLIDDERSPSKLKNLKIIKNSGKHLLSLINDILDFSKIEADRIDIENAPFALRGTLEHIQGLMRDSIQGKGLYLRTEFSEFFPVVVEGDEHRITQVLLNVLGNAVKFTAAGGITVRCDYRDGVAIIAVADTGVGIDKKKLELIFDPFQQADTSTERIHGGTGLGLAICRRLAELMGGSIRAESDLGEGSTFILELPLLALDVEEAELLVAYDDDTDSRMVVSWIHGAGKDEMLKKVVLKGIRDLPVKLEKMRLAAAERDPVAFANIVHDLKGYTGNLHLNEAYDVAVRLFDLTNSDGFVLQDAVAHLAELEGVIRKIPARVLEVDAEPGDLLEAFSAPLRVLTAEDNETNQELIRILLGGIGLESDFVGDGKAVLSRLEQNRYDLLLLDMQMPVMDGRETIEAIRRNDRYRDLHVIAITAHAMEGDADLYIGLGCNDYLSKPIDRELFAEKVTGVMIKKTGRHGMEAVIEVD